MRLRIPLLLSLFALLLLTVPATALAAADAPNTHLALPTVQVWALVAGALVPLVTYVLNHYAPWCSEPVKALAHVVTSAIAGALVQAIDTGNVGLNDQTLQLVVAAIVAALFAHGFLWKPSGIAARLKAGTNAPTG